MRIARNATATAMFGRFPTVTSTPRSQDTPPNQDRPPSPSQRTSGAGVPQAIEGPPGLTVIGRRPLEGAVAPRQVLAPIPSAVDREEVPGRSQFGTASKTDLPARAKGRPIDLLDAPTRELVRSTVSAVSTLSGLDTVLAVVNGPSDPADTNSLARLSSTAKLALLQGLAERLPDVPDHPDPYRSLARSALLHAAASLPAPYKGGLASLETGRMFETAEQAVQCGVPISKAAVTFRISDQGEIQRLNWVAEYAAKGHIYAGYSVSETAALHGISEDQVLVGLQPASVETAAGAAVAAGAMTVDEAVHTFGITDRDEIDVLNSYAEIQPTEFMQAILAGTPLGAAYGAVGDDEVIDRARAEYLSVMSPHVTVSLQSGEDVRDLAKRLELTDPFARRLLERRAAEIGAAS